MMETFIWIASIMGYLAITLLVAGYLSGKWTHEWNLKHHRNYPPSYNYDHPGVWWCGAFWPLVAIYSLFFVHLLNIGSRMGMRNQETRRVRIELEKKIRVEQDRIEREAEAEVEAILRKNRAA